MSVNSVKMYKETHKKENNTAAEVFVMPPNLLKKLGIHLGNISNSTKYTEPEKQDQVVSGSSNIEGNTSKTEDVEKDNDSILETASLMKKSVFLSPTFTANDSNVISAEVEIAQDVPNSTEIITTPITQPLKNPSRILEIDSSLPSYSKANVLESSKKIPNKDNSNDTWIGSTTEQIDVQFNQSVQDNSTTIPNSNTVNILSDKINIDGSQALFLPTKTISKHVAGHRIHTNDCDSSDLSVEKKISEQLVEEESTYSNILCSTQESSDDYDLCNNNLLISSNTKVENTLESISHNIRFHILDTELSASHDNHIIVGNANELSASNTHIKPDIDCKDSCETKYMFSMDVDSQLEGSMCVDQKTGFVNDNSYSESYFENTQDEEQQQVIGEKIHSDNPHRNENYKQLNEETNIIGLIKNKNLDNTKNINCISLQNNSDSVGSHDEASFKHSSNMSREYSTSLKNKYLISETSNDNYTSSHLRDKSDENCKILQNVNIVAGRDKVLNYVAPIEKLSNMIDSDNSDTSKERINEMCLEILSNTKNENNGALVSENNIEDIISEASVNYLSNQSDSDSDLVNKDLVLGIEKEIIKETLTHNNTDDVESNLHLTGGSISKNKVIKSTFKIKKSKNFALVQNGNLNINMQKQYNGEASIKDLTKTNDVDSTVLQTEALVLDKHMDTNTETKFNNIDKTNKFNSCVDKKNIPVDKVSEIALYLSSIFKCREKAKNVKSYLRGSDTKLNIHGVEKPGGAEHNIERLNENIRTYQRQSRISKKVFLPLSTQNLQHNKDVDNNADITMKVCPVITKREFCICSDFGQLDFYDKTRMYEHVHFSNSVNVGCNLDVIFSIYNEDAMYQNVNEIDPSNYSEVIEDKNTSDFNICWSDMPDEEFSINTTILMTDTNVEENKQSVDRKHLNIDSEISPEEDDDSQITQKDNIILVNHSNKENDSNKAYEDFVIVKDTVKGSVPKELNNGQEIGKEDKMDILGEVVEFNVSQNNEPTIVSDNTLLFTSENNSQEKEGKDQIRENILSSDDSVKKRTQSAYQKKSDGPALKKKAIKCGVCPVILSEYEWDEHIAQKHCYIAWKDGATVDLESYVKDTTLNMKINDKLNSDGVLTCPLCALTINTSPSFITHVKECYQNKTKKNKKEKKSSKLVNNIFQCAVCGQNMESSLWIDHIASKHNYLAWREGSTPWDLTDTDAVWERLNLISRDTGGLVCAKCGVIRKYAKQYLSHINRCKGNQDYSMLSVNTYEEHDTIVNDSSKNEDSSCLLSDKQDKSNSSHLNQSVENTEREGIDKIKRNTVKCGVCAEEVEFQNWYSHIQKEHNYKAWKDGDVPLDLTDDEFVWDHLNVISKKIGGLVCAKCGIIRKYVKQYLAHIKKCEGDQNDTTPSANTSIEHDLRNDSICVKESPILLTRRRKMSQSSNISEAVKTIQKEGVDKCKSMEPSIVTCGVCAEEMESTKWIGHSQKKHDYLAWRDGDEPLDLTNDHLVWDHLNVISKKIGGLVCAKCGIIRKYVKQYLAHIKKCEGSLDDSTANANTTFDNDSSKDDSICEKDSPLPHPHQHKMLVNCTTLSTESNQKKTIDKIGEVSTPTVKCGVCAQEMESKNWINHIRKEHNYMAWRDGDVPINFDNVEDITTHLLQIVAKVGSLLCPKCGVKKKRPKVYLKHTSKCVQGSTDMSVPSLDGTNTGDMCQCGVCLAELYDNEWSKHAMEQHYNVAWKVGETPLDLNDAYMIDKLLRQYRKSYPKLICKVCETSKASNMGFYAHVLVCGKTDEETEQFKTLCEVCKKKYMIIYKNQHMRAHLDTQLAKEKKQLLQQQRKNEEGKNRRESEENMDISASRKTRRAAQKARNVIEEYSANDNGCDKCDSNNEECKCVKRKDRRMSVSDMSGQFDQSCSESNHSSELEIDDNVSDEEENADERKKKPESSQFKIQRIPFHAESKSAYLEQSFKEYRISHLTDEHLFDGWRDFECTLVKGKDLDKYLPPLKDSCRIRMMKSDWMTLTRFEAIRMNGDHLYKTGMGIFTGGTVQCMRWAPSRTDEHSGRSGHWLASSSHLSVDQPRLNCDQLYEHSALIQIWDAGDFDKILPKLALGLALDCGTVWAMDWCPSGARDLLPEETGAFDKPLRLGLLAVAFSNGKVYIYSIPYPPTIVKDDNIFIKLKPVVELRLTSGEDRELYQATTICWSTQKGHSLITVGYGDGTVAFYDITTNSPLLKTVEGNMLVFSPYHDEKFHNSSITGLDMYPGNMSFEDSGRADIGAWGASAVTGGSLRVGGASRCWRTVHATLVTNGLVFLPHWPSIILTGEESLTSTVLNELEVWGPGRRTGGVRTVSACPRCARIACFTAPHVRTLLEHPISGKIIKHVVAEVAMAPFGSKVNEKPPKDELTLKLEPNTYDQAITKYGITFRPVDDTKRSQKSDNMASQTKFVHPERYPLADVTALAFCTTLALHDRLAVATHAGVIFFLKV